MRAEVVSIIGEVPAVQADGSPPTTLVAGSARGETGVSVISVRHHGGMPFRATPRPHCICFRMSRVRVERRMPGRVVCHEPPEGSLTINPAGSDCPADADDTIETLLVAIDPAWLAPAAAEGSQPTTTRADHFSGTRPREPAA